MDVQAPGSHCRQSPAGALAHRRQPGNAAWWRKIMRKILMPALLVAAVFYANCALALDSSGTPVVVTPLASRTTTASGQPITLPRKNVQVLV
jgi:hypothetical protein